MTNFYVLRLIYIIRFYLRLLEVLLFLGTETLFSLIVNIRISYVAGTGNLAQMSMAGYVAGNGKIMIICMFTSAAHTWRPGTVTDTYEIY